MGWNRTGKEKRSLNRVLLLRDKLYGNDFSALCIPGPQGTGLWDAAFSGFVRSDPDCGMMGFFNLSHAFFFMLASGVAIKK
jgi:hypothetical protein